MDQYPFRRIRIFCFAIISPPITFIRCYLVTTSPRKFSSTPCHGKAAGRVSNLSLQRKSFSDQHSLLYMEKPLIASDLTKKIQKNFTKSEYSFYVKQSIDTFDVHPFMCPYCKIMMDIQEIYVSADWYGRTIHKIYF